MTTSDKNNENSFRNILKGTSIFGGVQIFNILISAVRLKFVAMILGPVGMGIAGLFNNASLTIQQFASLGLNLSIVKEIGHSKNDEKRLSKVLGAIKPLILISGLIGALICLLMPKTLSSFTFGDDKYTGGFILLSAAVFFSIVGTALMSVLQGLHAIKPLSRATIIGSFVGLTIGVPLYWLYGTEGIVPALIIIAVSTCVWYFISLRKVLNLPKSPWNKELHLPIVKSLIFMGLVLMSNDIFRNLANYIVNIFIRRQGSMEEVGFYQSCTTMTMQYSAIVFSAMAMDYLPRLATASHDNFKMCEVVNRQIEIVGLVIAPVASSVIFLAPWVIEIFQTEKFLSAVTLLRLMAMGIVVRALMYPLGYIVFTKDNKRLFFWMESVGANILTLCLACGGYKLMGLNGLGIAAIIDCSICLCVYILVNHKLYRYSISSSAGKIMSLVLLACLAMTAITFTLHGLTMIISATALLLTTSWFSVTSLLKRVQNS